MPFTNKVEAGRLGWDMDVSDHRPKATLSAARKIRLVRAVPRDQVDEVGVHLVRWVSVDFHFAARQQFPGMMPGIKTAPQVGHGRSCP
jgi:hypothetical protein